MRLRPLCAVVLMFLFAPTTTWASDHVASMFGGYSPLLGSHHKGLSFGLEVSWPTDNLKIHDHVGILVDAAVYGGTDDAGSRFTKTALVGGLRLINRFKDANGNDRPLIVFVHGLVGRHRSHIGSTVDDGWAAAAGGGLDILLREKPTYGLALRFQGDWVRVAGESAPRVSLGLAYRFKEAPLPKPAP